MRALLVCNPKATTTSERVRDVLVRALRSETELEAAYTRHRGHAVHLARAARTAGVEVVVALGGDGTVNEVVNGLLADGLGPDAPALAVVSGGSTNVFARALGLPHDWAEGTAVILEALRERRTRDIGLGRANDRYFTFCAGFGLDAEVIHRVERARLRGRKATPMLYVQSLAGNYMFDPRSRAARLTLERPGAPSEDGLSMAVVQNTAPWTYVGDRPIDANPEASFDLGLDVMALRDLSVTGTVRTMTQLVMGRKAKDSDTPIGPHGKHVLRLHDLSEFTIRANSRIGFHVDGDFLGQRNEVRFSAVTKAIRVVC
jgi:diacylglycerol kinase family enzyme